MDNETMDRIGTLCNAAIEEARSDKANMGAVNWGDIGVRDVIHCRNLSGEEWYQVRIEEASPNCRLATFVRGRVIGKMPGLNLEVLTEW